MTSGQIKLLVAVFAFVNVWLLFHIPSVADSVLKFLTAGIVPGTDKELSPDTMMYGAAATFLLAAILIFWKQIFSPFRRRRLDRRTATNAPVPVLAPVKVTAETIKPKQPVVVRKQPKPMPIVIIKNGRIKKPRTWSLRSVMTSVVVATLTTTASVGERISAYAKKVWQAIVPVMHKLWANICKASKVTWGFICRMYKLLVILAKEIWCTVEPYLRRFDKWLEKQLHRNQKTATALNLMDKGYAKLRKASAKMYLSLKSFVVTLRNMWHAAGNSK